MYGKIIDNLPEGYVPFQQWPEFDPRTVPLSQFKPEVVGFAPRGTRWGWWPFTFEEYVSEQEPDLSLSDPHHGARTRIVLWRRLTRHNPPAGWHHISNKTSRLDGFADLAETEYEKRWDESARRYRRKWLSTHCNKTHRIENVSFDEFAAGYRAATVTKKIGTFLLDHIERQMASDAKGVVELLGVRNSATGQLVAGMATLTSLSCRASHYISGFVCDSAGAAPVMLGLMDHWFSTSQQRGTRFLLFGEFWQPGKPKNWKGFSLFKAKFGLHYIAYPSVLFRFVRGKFF